MREITNYLQSYKELNPAIINLFEFITKSNSVKDSICREFVKSNSCKYIKIPELTIYIKEKQFLLLSNINFVEGINIISGVNGAGKTLLTEYIAGYSKNAHGKILYSINNPEKKLESVRVASQHPHIFDTDFAFGTFSSGSSYKSNTHHNLDDLYKEFPLFNRTVGSKLELSSGEKQIVNIFKVLYADPEVLIIDEALSNVALDFRKKILNYISKYRSDKINIIINHDYLDCTPQTLTHIEYGKCNTTFLFD